VVVELLRAAPALKVLVTSRESLNVRGEWRYPISGLAVPSEDGRAAQEAEPDLERYDAVALWVQSARRVCPAFSLAQDPRPVIRICQLVEGMPLAIELAASWLKTLPPIAIAAEVERGLDLFITSWRDVAPGHRSMRAVFDRSWRLLSGVEAAVLRRLALFAASFGLRAAQAVAGASLPTLVGLVEKSLLRVTPAGRYHMHELLRQYALERLEENPLEAEQTRERYGAYYAAFLRERAAALKSPGQQTALAELDVQIENARAAWNWAAERGQAARLDAGMEGLCLYYDWRLRAAEGEAACGLAAERLRRATTADGLRVLAKVLAWQGFFNAQLGGRELADALLERSLSLLESPALADQDTRAERALVLYRIGDQAFGRDWEKAGGNFEQSLALYRELGEEWRTAHALNSLGWLAVYVGEMDQGIRFFRESLAIHEKLGDARGIADALRSLGTAVGVAEKPEEGEQLQRRSLTIWRKLEDRVGIVSGLNQLAVTLIFFGRFDEARAMFEESLAICHNLGLRRASAWAEVWLAFAELHHGDYQRARTHGETALALGRELGDQPTIGRALWFLGAVTLAEGADAEGQRTLEGSVAVYRAYGLPDELIMVLADLAVAALWQGLLGQAQQHLCEALHMVTASRMVFIYALPLPATALLLAELGQAEQAVELYALASRDPHVSSSRWFEDVVGRRMAKVSAGLPPEVVAAAQERGRARDLEATMAQLLEELQELG
jgi:tetratricopeptide (TPR) repeat protein